MQFRCLSLLQFDVSGFSWLFGSMHSGPIIAITFLVWFRILISCLLSNMITCAFVPLICFALAFCQLVHLFHLNQHLGNTARMETINCHTPVLCWESLSCQIFGCPFCWVTFLFGLIIFRRHCNLKNLTETAFHPGLRSNGILSMIRWGFGKTLSFDLGFQTSWMKAPFRDQIVRMKAPFRGQIVRMKAPFWDQIVRMKAPFRGQIVRMKAPFWECHPRQKRRMIQDQMRSNGRLMHGENILNWILAFKPFQQSMLKKDLTGVNQLGRSKWKDATYVKCQKDNWVYKELWANFSNAGGRTCPCDRCYCDPSHWRVMPQTVKALLTLTTLQVKQHSLSGRHNNYVNHILGEVQNSVLHRVVHFVFAKLSQFAHDMIDRYASQGLHPSHGLTLCVLNPYLIWGRLGSIIYACQHRRCLGCAIRFGEAKNPGPESPQNNAIKFCITNPTCLMNKSDTYTDLSACGYHYIAMSETAATENLQNNFAKSMRQQGLRVQWGVPVVPFRQTTTGKETHRGKASGVGLLSRLPIRKARLTVPTPWDLSTRFAHCISQVGPTQFQVIVLYGKTLSVPGAQQYNDELLTFAFSQANQIPLPTIFLGDFNTPVTQFALWGHLQSRGYQNLLDIHKLMYGFEMPPTCMDSTHPDMAIIPPELVSYITHVSVLGKEWFATHRPVCFEMQLPSLGILRTHLRFPRQFVEYGLDKNDFESAAEHCHFEQPDTFEHWESQVEHLADLALASKSIEGGQSHLPRAARGRCQKPEFIQSPLFQTTKRGRQGDYEPSHEVVTIKAKRQVTQLRRLQSFTARIKKFENVGPTTPMTVSELHQEWNAIQKCSAWGPPFLYWLQQFPELEYAAWPLPTHDWLFQVCQFVRHHVDITVSQDAIIFKNKLEYGCRLDKTEGSNKAAFKQVKGTPIPPLSELRQTIEELVAVVPTDNPLVIEVFGNQVPKLKKDFPLTLDGNVWKIHDITDDCALIEACNHSIIPSETADLVQHQYAFSTTDIAKGLNDYWQPIWQREETDFDYGIPSEEVHQIILDFPAHPAIEVDMLNVSIWQKVIQKQKPHSARGIDRISNQELRLLPTKCIESLANLMLSFHQGFPSWFMQGLTVPMPKTTDIPNSSQTRPITILAMLYRVWSAVAFYHVIRILSTWVPPGVTGLLPKRGAHTAAYATQWAIEQAKFLRKSSSGFVLDLKKCFNCIRWECGYHFLKNAGVPSNLLQQWFLSIRRLTRQWLIHQEVIGAGAVTCGFPEGDVWSVLVMIVVAMAWVVSVMKSCAANPQPALSAYADNWSWILQNVEHHLSALQATLRVTRTCGLTIDFSKTWYWSTCNHDAVRIVDMLQPLLPPNSLHRKKDASDLGHQMQYTGASRLGVIRTRIDEGFSRMTRVKAMRRDLDTKESMLLCSVYPAAFHGCEIRPISSDCMQDFRSKATSALLGDSYSASPAIALLCATRILDPEYYTIERTLLAARSFLMLLSEAEQHTFYLVASQFRGTLHKVRGPASAFSFCLRQVGWLVDQQGMIILQGSLKFPLVEISAQRIKRFLAQAWRANLVVTHTLRKNWFGFPDISHEDTRAVLKQFDCSQRRFLLKLVSGGFQTAPQKLKWTGREDDKCEFCDMQDSQTHRLLHCPIGNSVRIKYSSMIAELENEGFSFSEFPVVTVMPYQEMIQQLHFQSVIPDFPEVILNLVESRKDSGIRLHWFTDGSSQCPHIQSARFSAFHVALDLCETDEDRVSFENNYLTTDTLPSIIPVISSRTPGEQDILRAEMYAIATIILQANYGDIHTDSQTAIHHFDCMMEAVHPSQFMFLDHSDILLQVWRKATYNHVKLHKVKAHTIIKNISSPLDRYWCIGNKVADEGAQFAVNHLCPEFVQELQNNKLVILKQRNLLKQVFELHLELRPLRMQALQADTSSGGQALTTQAICDALCNWKVPTPMVFEPNYDLRFLESCLWGHEVAIKTVRWLEQFVWAPDNSGPLHQSTGISWIELATSWMIFNKMYLPVKRPGVHGPCLVIPANFVQAQEHRVTISEMGTNMKYVFDNLSALVPQTLIPLVVKKKVGSLYQLGYKQFTQGWSKRPEVPAQGQTVTYLFGQFTLHNVKNLEWVPNINTDMVADHILGDWTERQKNARKSMLNARALRKNLADG